MDHPPMYRPSVAGGCLRQAEIVSDLVQAFVPLDQVRGTEPAAIAYRTHPFAVLLTQDCDLEQDFRVRTAPAVPDSPPKGQDKLLHNLLFAEAVEAAQLFARVASNKRE